jgi:hypothetical protein
MSPLTDQLTEKWRQQGVTADPVLRMSICMVASFVAAQSDVTRRSLLNETASSPCAKFCLAEFHVRRALGGQRAVVAIVAAACIFFTRWRGSGLTVSD